MNITLVAGQVFDIPHKNSVFNPSDLLQNGPMTRPQYDPPSVPNLPGYCETIPMPNVPEVTVTRISDGHDVGVYGNQHRYSTIPAFNSNNELIYFNDRIVELFKTRVYLDGVQIDEVSGRKWVSNLPVGTTGELRIKTFFECHDGGRTPFRSEHAPAYTDPNVSFGILSGLSSTTAACYDRGTDQTTIAAVGGANSSMGFFQYAHTHDDRWIIQAWQPGGSAQVQVIDLVNKTIAHGPVAVGDVADDWIGLHPSGDWILAQDNNVTYRFDNDLTNQTLLVNDSGHTAMGWDSSGNQVAVFAEQDPFFVDIQTKQVKQLPYTGGGTGGYGHFSMPKDRPGYMYHSGSSDVFRSGASGIPMLVSVEVTDGQEDFEFWGWHFNGNKDEYDNEPKAAVDNAGNKWVTTSTWGVDGDRSYEFLVELKVERGSDGLEVEEVYNLVTDSALSCGDSTWE